ncbi:hypothetical protein L914_21559 [Phytophthora nicotianae]|uniref:MULE transposase domain-containing protein n=2 Tax=Phytophthora nicotianae TaxID=4792 RepID=V9DS57_PHYNI|nr:hypothetical protein F443_23159 [Phytophthora nicotianae P1569]ETM30766.1 hypothetical protein L914_21559 [Phytophthora nicotianae]
MGYDLVFDLYLPILYVLLPDKQQDTYWHLLDNVIMQSDLQVDLRYTTCDFEMGLLNTVRQQFTGFSVVDCLFHCKHALPQKGIPFVRRRVDELGHQVQWDTSWRYFTRTWVRNYDPTPWNIQAISESTDIVNRTNNALERFKRDRDESFTSAHSKLLTLLAVIADGESLCCQDGGHTPQLPAGSRAGKSGWVEIPAEYRQFCEE